jgi:periodic tryptophan protein 1
MSDLISAVSWVRRGVAQRHPTKYVLDDGELERVSKLARIELEDARADLEKAHKAALEMGKDADDEENEDEDEEGAEMNADAAKGGEWVE